MAVKLKRTMGGKVGHGSTEDIKAVQGLLNRHASTVGYKKVEEDGDCGKNTIKAIKEFQKRCVTEVKPDGRVEPGKPTLLGLNMSASNLKTWLKGNESDDPNDAAQSISITLAKKTYEFSSQNELDKFLDTVVIIEPKGKPRAVFIGKEWDVFHADMIRTLKRTVVAGARQRSEMAMGLWTHFAELNNDQYVVAWFVSLAGPDLPSFSLVDKASVASKNLENAVNGGDFKKIEKAIAAAEVPINKAYDKMMAYQKDVIGSAENCVTALEIVKTGSFIIVGAIAAPLIAPTVGVIGAGALASGGTAMVSSTSNELGKYSAGTSDGLKSALKNIALDTVIDATVGAVLKGGQGKKIFEGVSKHIVKKTASKWISKISSKTAQKYITAYLEHSVKAGVEESIKQAGEIAKGKTKPEDFFANVGKAMITAGILKDFDKVVDTNMGPAIFKLLLKNSKTKDLFGDLAPKVATGIITDIIKGNAGNFAGKGLDYALNAATGKESESALVDTAAKKVSGDSKFQKLLAEKIKKRK